MFDIEQQPSLLTTKCFPDEKTFMSLGICRHFSSYPIEGAFT